MSWRERLQPASIRGVGFFVDTASGQGGRRVAQHQYPLQEQGWAEDLGKKEGNQTLQAFLVGADYDLEREDLLAALDKPGPAELKHPYMGTLRVQVTDYEWTISSRQGGYCKISINYLPAGERKYPVATQTNARNLSDASDRCSAVAEDAFANTFSCSDKPAWVAEEAQALLGDALDSLRAINGRITAALQPIGDLTSQIDQLGGELATLISQPRTLASNLMGVIAGVFGMAADIENSFDGYTGLLNSWSGTDSVSATTPNRQAQANNQAAIVQLLSSGATVAMSRQVAIALDPTQSRTTAMNGGSAGNAGAVQGSTNVAGGRMPGATSDHTNGFESQQQALVVRDRLLEELDTLAVRGDDASYYALTELQTALMRAIDQAAADLQQVEQIQIGAPMPALALAHRLYGDARRADELGRRNALANPNFVPAGQDIEVLK